MFQILTMTEVHLATFTKREETHGDEKVATVSIGVKLTGANTLLDAIDPQIRHALYKAVDDQEQLPGVEAATPVLRCNSFEKHSLTASHEGWTLCVDDGIDDTQPMTFGGCKVDKLSFEAKQGGSVELAFRIGTSDLDAERLGKLGMLHGHSMWITLTAPKPKAAAIDGTTAAFQADHPEAGDLFAAEHGGPDDEADGEGDTPDADGPQDLEDRLDGALAAADGEQPTDPQRGDNWPFPRDGAAASDVTEKTDTSHEVVIDTGSKRTARGREKTKAALAAGAS